MDNRPLLLLWPVAVLALLLIVLIRHRRQGSVGGRAFVGYLVAILAITAIDVGFVLS